MDYTYMLMIFEAYIRLISRMLGKKTNKPRDLQQQKNRTRRQRRTDRQIHKELDDTLWFLGLAHNLCLGES